jgi:hypothetical protein
MCMRSGTHPTHDVLLHVYKIMSSCRFIDNSTYSSCRPMVAPAAVL